MDHASYRLAFSAGGDTDDVVEVHPTDEVGPSGLPLYSDDTHQVQVEIDGDGEARMVPTSVHPHPVQPSGCWRLG
ncbi:DUF6296 family protein [Streptacidiphilus neutrinimicus]|uniref:DUF6296 family protein n=1 Tax=Streptacidiphilus neutrinimicus TaxID=105420 RepID=UPI0005A6EBC4|nr:DUF6296 family protein [Streptacidiphilus neutrinimicus]